MFLAKKDMMRLKQIDNEKRKEKKELSAFDVNHAFNDKNDSNRTEEKRRMSWSSVDDPSYYDGRANCSCSSLNSS